jgi:dipeptidyl aminopeptidase/acylaminoacyl peptidase
VSLFSVSRALAVDSAERDPAREGVRRIGELVLDGVPEIPERIVERTNQYQNVRSAQIRDWTPNGSLLISTRFADTPQLHLVDFPLGARRQVTFFQEPVSQGVFGKGLDSFLFLKDTGGNEASQIYQFDLTTGKARLLSDGSSQNGLPLYSNAKDRVLWRSTARNKKDHDIWLMGPEQPEAKRIALEVEGYWEPLDWSPDDSKALVIHSVSVTETYLWVLDVQTGEAVPFGNHEKVNGEPIAYGPARFDRKGEGAFFTSDEGTPFRNLRYSKFGSSKEEIITRGIDWDVEGLVISPDRGTLAFEVNVNGAEELYIMRARTRDYEKVELPLGVIANLDFSPDGESLAFSFQSTSSPEDVYVLDVRSKKVTRWTESEVGGLDSRRFRRCELVHYPTFDKDERGQTRMIPAFLFKPEGEGPFPVIVKFHGGPESQTKALFSYNTQYEINELGCAVVYPNVRGSTGFGKAFVKLDDGFLREDSVKDFGALLDWIETEPDLDETRVAVIGGSYGGYMVLAALTHYSDRIRAGVESVGISNFVTFLENTSEYRRDLRRVEYGDERDRAMREFLQRISPTTNVDKIDVPLLVIQGANDPRVPASEAEQIVKAVRAKGREVWYMLAMDEGHGFDKKANRDQSEYAKSLFWEKYLLGEEPMMKAEKKTEVPGGSR